MDFAIQPDTEIRIAVAIGGAEASIKLTVAKPMTMKDLQKIAGERVAAVAKDAFDAFADADAAGIPISPLVDEV